LGDEKTKMIPKWLMGWRDITNATNERTVIVGAIQIVAVSNKYPIMLFNKDISSSFKLLILGNLNSIVFDYVARQKIGGTTLNYFLIKQFPVLPPTTYSQEDINSIVPCVFELTYTAVDLIPFAEDLWDSADAKMRRVFLKQRHGEKAADFEEFVRYNSVDLDSRISTTNRHEPSRTEEKYDNAGSCSSSGSWLNRTEKKSKLAEILPPFVFGQERRALLRAALDARYARLYGLSRNELRYILDPADVMGEDYPSETFRVLKEKEIAEFGEYRTRRLVLEAWGE